MPAKKRAPTNFAVPLLVIRKCGSKAPRQGDFAIEFLIFLETERAKREEEPWWTIHTL